MLTFILAANILHTLFGQAPTTPEAFLKWSMDRYHAMRSFQATVTISERYNTKYGAPENKADIFNRSVLFERPNRFKITGVTNQKRSYCSVSDGQTVTEYSDNLVATFVYPAPKTIWGAKSIVMRLDAGSPLYPFFGGSTRLSSLAKTDRIPIALGAEETIRGEKCRMVKFFARGIYGHVRAEIGESSGLVYRLSYDLLPVISMMGDPDPTAKPRKPIEPDALDPRLADPANWFRTTTESYDIASPAGIKPDSFRAQIPHGAKVIHVKTESGDDFEKKAKRG